MHITTISELQGKAEILLDRLMDAKESALKDSKKESSMVLTALIRCSVIEINSQMSKDKKSSGVTDKIILLEELKSVLFDIDGITDEERKVKTKKRDIVTSRQIIMAVYHKTVKHVSLVEAGNLYDLDHTTVMNACKIISNLRETDKAFDKQYLAIWEWASYHNPYFTLLPKGKS